MSRRKGRSAGKSAEKATGDSVEKFLADDASANNDTVRELRGQIAALERRLQKARSKTEIVIDAVDLILRDNLPVLRAPKLPAKQRKKEEEIAVLHWSDHQLGKVTASYNTVVAEDRVMQCVEKTVLITDMRRQNAAIRELHVYLGGDMVEGEEIFPGQAFEIDAGVMEQACLIGPRIYAKALLALAEHFERIVVCCVPGNHGRSSRTASRDTNWDSALYHSLRAWLGDGLGGRIEFKIAETFYVVDRVFDHGNLLFHGHQIRGGFAGFPWYGAAKRMWGWIDAIDDTWSGAWCGHFHTAAMMTLNYRRLWANGTLESGNAYAQEELSACGRPTQRLAYFAPEHGLIADHLLTLK